MLILKILEDFFCYQIEHDFDLILVADWLKRLLYDPAAVHLQCQCEHVATKSLRKRDLMLGGAEFKKFLKLFNFLIANQWNIEWDFGSITWIT